MANVTRAWRVADPRSPPFRELVDAEAHMLRGGSCLVTGLAGTGKSTLIRAVVAELEAKGKRVKIIAKTHNAALVAGAGADTADHFAYQHIREGATSADTIWVDEVSMLDIGLLQDLNHLRFR